MLRFAAMIFLGVVLVVLSGCGQKGPLVRPGSAPASAHSAPALPSDLPTPIPDDGGP